VLDFSAVAAVDYTGACALLSACDDILTGLAARLSGGGADVTRSACTVFFAGVAESDAAGGVGPLLRRCAVSLGRQVTPPAPDQLLLMRGAQWSIGSIQAHRDVDAALRAAADTLTARSLKSPPATQLVQGGRRLSHPSVSPADAVLELPLLSDAEKSVNSVNAPHEPKAEDAVEGLPLSVLTKEWTRQRREQEGSDASIPVNVSAAAFVQAAPAAPQKTSISAVLERTASRSMLLWWLLLPVRVLWGTFVLLSEMIGSSDPAAPMLRVL
jgi:hypothetical protein